MQLTAIIVEDEKHARDELKYLLHLTKKIKVIHEVEQIHEALWHIQKLQPDVVFLDIQLGKGTGIQLAEQFNNLKKKPAIVFVTAYDEYAIQAFELDAVDYLLKPIEESRLNKTIDKLTTKLINHKSEKEVVETIHNNHLNNILVNDGKRMVFINLDDIYYISTENRQVFIKTKDYKYKVDTLLYKIKEKLNDDFIQVHRGNIVNLTKVSAIEPWFNGAYNLVLQNGSQVPVSRTYAKKLRQMFHF